MQVACTTGGGEFAFEGAFGVGLLTDAEIVEQDFRVLDATFNRRGIIYAQLDTADAGEVHTFCTHLTPIFDDVPFPGEETWESEQAAQIATLLDFVAEKTTPEDQVLLLGDLNTGPELGEDVAAEAPENFAALIAGGDFEAPYLSPGAECTFCAANPLVPDESDSVIIDHVLTRGFAEPALTDRILDGDIQLNVDGMQVTTAFSDHYGVAATL